jgi:hypothetical protein
MILLPVGFVPQQIPGLGSSNLVTLVYIASFVVLTLVSLLFAARIQASMMLSQLGGSLAKFEAFKNNSRKDLLDYLTANCKVTFSDAQREVDRIIEYFTILPESTDPAGGVGKIEQVVRLQDDRTRQEIKELAPGADPIEQSIAQNMLEVASALSQFYKLMRHYYLTGQKMKNPYILAQAQMTMPILLKMAEAYCGALEAFKHAQPVGDGIGEMVAGRLMRGREKTVIARETWETLLVLVSESY